LRPFSGHKEYKRKQINKWIMGMVY